MLKQSGVYKIKSPSGKVYIGQSSNIKRRMTEHLYSSKNKNTKLYASIRKYGFSNHDIEILFLSDVESEKNKMEQFFINYYDSINRGLNLIDVEGSRGSFSGKKHSEKEIKRIKDRMSGVTPEWAIEKRRKGVFCSLNNKRYKSITDCAKDLNVSHALISLMLNGKTPNKYKVEKI
jgi:group I intron endonuclease